MWFGPSERLPHGATGAATTPSTTAQRPPTPAHHVSNVIIKHRPAAPNSKGEGALARRYFSTRPVILDQATGG